MMNNLSIVYDVTRQCPWNCAICCMGAEMKKNECVRELSFEEKMDVVEKIAEVKHIRNVRVDFSGGEIFTDMRNVEVIEHAAEILGCENIGISSSGYMIDDKLARRLSKCICECEMTMDVAPGQSYSLRPRGYALAAAKAVPFLKKYGITTGIQTVLAQSNCQEKILRDIYSWICNEGVECWSLLKFYPSGRGADYPEEQLNEEMEAWVVGIIQEMHRRNTAKHKPKIDFHYTMKGHEKYSDECRCVKKSIGIMPDGEVTACFWAVDSNTGIIAPKFRLGNLKEQTLTDIILGEKAEYWMNCRHCCELKAA